MDYKAVIDFGNYLEKIKKSTMEKHKVERSKEEMELFESNVFLKDLISSKYITPLEYKEIPDEEYTSDLKQINAIFQEAYKKYDFDTFSLMFVEYCNFCYIYGTTCENVIDIAISFISNETERLFLSTLGTGILMTGKDAEKFVVGISTAIEIYPTNQAALLYDFLLNLRMYSRTMKLSTEYIGQENGFFNEIVTDYQKLSPELLSAILNSDIPLIPHARFVYNAQYNSFSDEDIDEDIDEYEDSSESDEFSSIALRKELVIPFDIQVSINIQDLYVNQIILSASLKNKQREIEDTNIELDNKIKENNSMINDFSHAAANMDEYGKLYELADSLKNIDASELNINEIRQKLLSEYSQRVGLSINIEMLKFKFSDPDRLCNELSESSCADYDEPGLRELLSHSAKNFLVSLFFSNNKRIKRLRESVIDNFDWITLQNHFDNEIAFSEESDAFEWMTHNMVKISCSEISISWNNLHVYMEDFAYFFLINIFGEVIKNIFLHGDLKKEIVFSFTETDNMLVFSFENYICEKSIGRTSGEGLKSMCSTIDIINRTYPDIDSMYIESDNDKFLCRINLNKKIFLKEQ